MRRGERPLALARCTKSLCSTSTRSARSRRVNTAAAGRASVNAGRVKLRTCCAEVVPRVDPLGDPREHRPLLDEQQLEDHGDDDRRHGDEHERRELAVRSNGRSRRVGLVHRERDGDEQRRASWRTPRAATSSMIRRLISELTAMLFDTENPKSRFDDDQPQPVEVLHEVVLVEVVLAGRRRRSARRWRSRRASCVPDPRTVQPQAQQHHHAERDDEEDDEEAGQSLDGVAHRRFRSVGLSLRPRRGSASRTGRHWRCRRPSACRQAGSASPMPRRSGIAE